MTDEERSLFEALCDARDLLEQQVLGSQRLVEDVKAIIARMALYLIYRGKDEV